MIILKSIEISIVSKFWDNKVMQKQYGSPESPIWLLGDSNPPNWQNQLDYPFDPKHPARHNIWTPIADIIQEEVYLKNKMRLDLNYIFLMNAVENNNDKPGETDLLWLNKNIVKALEQYSQLVFHNKPKIIITFGSFSFEFVRRTLMKTNDRIINYKHWNTKNIKIEFDKSMDVFDINLVNLFPLLHVSIARRYFLNAHKIYSNKEYSNYFEYIGHKLGGLISNNIIHFMNMELIHG